MDLWGTITRGDAGGTVELRRRYSTTVSDLWQAVTVPDRLARWLAPVTGDLRPGGQYLIVFDPDDDSQRCGGTIEICDEPRELVVTWAAPGRAEPSRVRVVLTDDGGGTLLTLSHTGLGRGEDIGHAAGWEVYLRRLVLDIEPGGTSDILVDDWDAAWQVLADAHAEALGR